jgi:hypothetical protein
VEGTGRGLILRFFSGIRVDELRKTTKNLSQNGQSPGRDLKPGFPEYEGLLTTLALLSVAS